MAAALVPREMGTWSLTAVALGALEGGLLGVIVKNQFSDVAEPAIVNLCVALVAGAPAYSNLSSFFFASWASGKDKIRFLSRLMLLMAACLLVMSIPVGGSAGLAAFCILTVIARVAWTGILTVRAAVWRANYQRRWRAQVTARMVQLSSLIIAGFSALVGFALDWSETSYRLAFPLAAIAAYAASVVYRRARVRRHGRLIRSELADSQLGAGGTGLALFFKVLRDDRDFRRYMGGMLMFGSGNLMIIPMLVIVLNEQFTMARFSQVMITSSIPLVFLCFFIRSWARFLDGNHIFAYRAVHSWLYVSANLVFLLAGVLGQAWLLWPGSILLGIANAGGHLGWNLGHNDFSNDAWASLYMAIHVTLTGIRGLVAPMVGVYCYQYLADLNPPLAPWALCLPLLLSFSGSVWFVMLSREKRRQADDDQK
jgi:hypothetical protein